jgi:hypothetical protein
MAGSGTREDPWELTTANGGSAYQMWRDEAADPPVLVCQVGSTKLTYHLRAIDDLHAWLTAQFKSAALAQDRADMMSLWSGQGAPLLKHRHAAELLRSLVSETEDVLRR